MRRHLIHIFEYDFPEHYGEVLQKVIVGSSEQKLLPAVLTELLNAIYKLANCTPPDPQQTATNNVEIIKFASTQSIFPFKVLQDTMALLARHYQTERLQHGLHGLYPKHKDYCDTIAILQRTFGFSLITSAVHAYPGLLSDRCNFNMLFFLAFNESIFFLCLPVIEWIWPSLCDTFSPWLVPYYPQSMLQPAPANWIKQVLSNNDALLPWSELYTERARLMIVSLIDCLRFLLDTLPAGDAVLGNYFYWYEVHFGRVGVPRHIVQAVNVGSMLLPWNKFNPQPVHIESIYRCLQQVRF